MKILSYNIRFGGRGRESRIAEVINRAQPDVVLLQEATDTRVVDKLAESTGMGHRAAERGFSTAFMSRLPVAQHRWHHHRDLQRAVLEVELAEMRIFNVHLRATHSNYTERRRMSEVRAMLDFLKAYEDEFHFLIGDFNTLVPGELLNMAKLPTRYKVLAFLLGGRITYRALKIILDAGYIDAYRKFHTDPGFTFPAWDPHVRIDYLFTPQQFDGRIESCEVMTDIDDPAGATDHLPLLAEISTT